MSELTQKDYDAALIANLLDGPLNIEGGTEKAASDMRSAARRIEQLTKERDELLEALNSFVENSSVQVNQPIECERAEDLLSRLSTTHKGK